MRLVLRLALRNLFRHKPQNNYRLISAPRETIAAIVEKEPRLAAGLSRLMVGAILSSGENSCEAILVGIDAAARAAVYPAIELRQGRVFEPGERGFLLGAAGAFFGALLGTGAILVLGKVGIPAFSEARRYSYGGDTLYPVVNWADTLRVPAVMVAVCVLAAVGPAVMAARLRPAEALRYA